MFKRIYEGVFLLSRTKLRSKDLEYLTGLVFLIKERDESLFRKYKLKFGTFLKTYNRQSMRNSKKIMRYQTINRKMLQY